MSPCRNWPKLAAPIGNIPTIYEGGPQTFSSGFFVESVFVHSVFGARMVDGLRDCFLMFFFSQENQDEPLFFGVLISRFNPTKVMLQRFFVFLRHVFVSSALSW